MIAFESPVGGVMTDDAGAITGPLELVGIDGSRAQVRYAEAEDVYLVTGTVPDGWDEARVVEHLAADPGVDEDDNPAASRLPEGPSGAVQGAVIGSGIG